KRPGYFMRSALKVSQLKKVLDFYHSCLPAFIIENTYNKKRDERAVLKPVFGPGAKRPVNPEN
ncbi:MAG: hypothetical protein JW904_03010, partial [Spirochaetales bacterium]|nr:hypothetical protein [Spirochaetales bacterium]